MRHALFRLIAAYGIASITCVIAGYALTWKFETTGASLIVSLFVLPSIVLFVLVEKFSRVHMLKHIVYLAPAIGVSLWFLSIGLSESEGAPMAWYLFLDFSICAMVVYIFLVYVMPRIDRVRLPTNRITG